MSVQVKETPEQIIARVTAGAERRLTPCGEGHMVSHVWGSGPPLVLFHGNFGSWMHWIRNVEELSRHFRVIALDMPGFGDSALPPEPYSTKSISEIIAAGVLEIAGDQPITLVGFSFGGANALETTSTLGARARKLILVSTSRTMGINHPGPPEGLVKWRGLETQAEREAAHRRNLELVMISQPSRIDDLALTIQSRNTGRSRLRAAVARKNASAPASLAELKCPLGFIWAEKDASIGAFMQDRIEWIRKHRPEAPYTIIPDAGHWVPYEQPEAFNKALIELAS